MPVSPATAEDLAATVSALYEQVETVLIRRIRQAAAEGIDAPTWVEQKLASLGNLQAGIRSVVDALAQDSSGAVHQAVAEAYRRGQQAAVAELGALPAGVTQVVANDIPNAATIDRLAAALVNDTRATHLRILRQSEDTYRDVIARASAAPLVGAQTRRQAAQAALDDFANRGVTGFVDRSGRGWSLPSYIEMATRSAVGRAAVDAHTDRLGEAGVDLVIVSRAPEECPLCRRWESKVLVRSGAAGARTIEVEHATEDGRMVKVKVAGSLEEARAAGLMHPNCRHTVSAYLPGLTREPAPVPARGTYEQSQQQRYLERQVRKWKRLSEAALDEATRKAANARVRGYQSRIRDLVDESGMPRKPHREKLAEPSPQQHAELAEQQPAKPPEPEAKPEPVAPPEPQASVSHATRDRIEQVRRVLPKDREAWENARRVQVAPEQLGYDIRIAEFREELKKEEAEREQIVAETEAEFKRKRTPKWKRPQMLEDATRSIDSNIRMTQNSIRSMSEERDAFLRGDPGNYSSWLSRTEPPRYEYTYQKDPSGALLPPEAYEQHLNRVLEVGEALQDDLHDAFLQDSVLNELREEVRRISRNKPPDADALRSAQIAVAAREAETIRMLLADVRKLGGKVKAEAAGPDVIAARGPSASAVREDWQELLGEALDHFPKQWLDRMRDSPMSLVGSDRAYYGARQGPNGTDLFALDMAAPAWYNGAFSSYAAEVATHELGHRMEQYVPGLRELEYTLVRRRATKDGVLELPRQLAAIYPGASYRQGELTYEDQWADAYTGKTYERGAPEDPASVSSEAFQVGLQDLFGRSGRNFGGLELRQFVLGCLALL
ncbi:phage minor capsid protein [Streptomyces qaidamensis]|uniref:phage minor capsid protein n=1 Tax=Streptomyces qaidamensis TaxID=1783515 RepID=UPI00099F717C|nr:phage minor capsid protein [Streptomyces qaidamensis]